MGHRWRLMNMVGGGVLRIRYRGNKGKNDGLVRVGSSDLSKPEKQVTIADVADEYAAIFNNEEGLYSRENFLKGGLLYFQYIAELSDYISTEHPSMKEYIHFRNKLRIEYGLNKDEKDHPQFGCKCRASYTRFLDKDEEGKFCVPCGEKSLGKNTRKHNTFDL